MFFFLTFTTPSAEGDSLVLRQRAKGQGKREKEGREKEKLKLGREERKKIMGEKKRRKGTTRQEREKNDLAKIDSNKATFTRCIEKKKKKKRRNEPRTTKEKYTGKWIHR